MRRRPPRLPTRNVEPDEHHDSAIQNSFDARSPVQNPGACSEARLLCVFTLVSLVACFCYYFFLVFRKHARTWPAQRALLEARTASTVRATPVHLPVLLRVLLLLSLGAMGVDADCPACSSPVGYYKMCSTGSGATRACPLGKYQNSADQTACSNCPWGKYQASSAQSSCASSSWYVRFSIKQHS
jgi:hypothetical protein